MEVGQIACVILAAGSSTRMQGPNKLLLTVNGESLVHRTAREVSRVAWAEVVVVTGHQPDLIARELADLSLSLIYNPSHLSGMHSSIRQGLQVLRRPYAGVFVCLSDQPFFDHRTLLKLARTFMTSADIVYPTYLDQRGHPVLIGTDYVPEILSQPDGDHGCAYLFARHPAAVRPVAVAQLGILKDIDSPKDYEVYG